MVVEAIALARHREIHPFSAFSGESWVFHQTIHLKYHWKMPKKWGLFFLILWGRCRQG
jgi:hypothetical protein